MQMLAVLAIWVMAVAGAAAQLTCTPGTLRLDLVAAPYRDDPLATCGSSLRLDLNADCSVQLTSTLPAGASFLRLKSFFAAEPAVDRAAALAECPQQRPAVRAVRVGGTLHAGLTKREVVRRAVTKALSSFVHGADADAGPQVSGLSFLPGKLHLRRPQLPGLVYAITEASVSAQDLLQDDGVSPIIPVPGCDALASPDTAYSALGMCMENASDDAYCPDNTHAVMATRTGPSQQAGGMKVCGLCPAGTYGLTDDCFSCLPGTKSSVGGGCETCPAGTYSPLGSSVCVPCPSGTYSDQDGAAECKACAADTFAWIPGSKACLRCANGIPLECVGDWCPSDTPSPGTHIVAVGRMTARDGACNLDAASPALELKAWTKCRGWGSGLQLALAVAGDCSIQISPISDPTCSDPEDTAGYPYAAVQQRAFYTSDGAGNFRILSQPPTSVEQGPQLMLSITNVNWTHVAAKWFPAATSIRDVSSPLMQEVCSSTLRVVGGLVLDAGSIFFPVHPGTWACPPGTFYDEDQICPVCPLGQTCPGGPPSQAKAIPCPPGSYNSMLGLGGACPQCPTDVTSPEGAQQCDIDRPRRECVQDTSRSYTFDSKTQACQLCPAGTYRPYGTSLRCTPCPAGTFSAAGDALCTPCPAGQYSPFEGLADQTDVTGYRCLLCNNGSMPLKGGMVASVRTAPVTGATFCGACPAGTVLGAPWESCKPCLDDTYREGPATPGNNACKPIPPGFYLKDGSHARIEPCPRGAVSFYDNGDPATGRRVPYGQPRSCVSCLALDSTLGGGGPQKWAHTFAPRPGMAQCLPCPGGTVPEEAADGRAWSCRACPDGAYRPANMASASCIACRAGREVGPSAKLACKPCRPGYFMTAARATLAVPESNSCEPCPKNTFSPSPGANACLPCPAGTYAAGMGSTKCTPCAAAASTNQTGSGCGVVVPEGVSKPCPKGTRSDGSKPGKCRPCPPGHYSDAPGSRRCKECPGGTFSHARAASCKPCLPGFAAPRGSATCRICPRGYGTGGLQGQSRCRRTRLRASPRRLG